MSRISVISILLLLLSFSTVLALDKGQGAQATLLKEKSITEYRAVPQFATAELCSVRHAGDPTWLIYYWLSGNELYKSYQDPAMTCTAPYPFTVKEVFMVLYFTKPTIIYASVDVELVDDTDPLCPVPGELVSVSSEYGFQLDPPGLWRIAIPLDEPAVVNGPYFTGFFISTELLAPEADPLTQDSVFLITEDSVLTPWRCQNFNLWDTAVGYVDLGDPTNEFYTFPGKLLLYSAGETGGSGGYDPMPRLSFLEPHAEELTGTPLRSWAWDSENSKIVDSVRYEYRSSSSGWVRYGVDADKGHALRNGIDPSGTGPGYAINLGPAGLEEDLYRIRATAFDTLMRTASAQVDMTIDPTPPRMDFINPSYMDTICLPYTISTFTDEATADILSVKFYRKKLSTDYSVSVATLLQTDYGDVDYFAGDGNPIVDGEFGEYYCGPAAGAIAIDYWFNQGYTQLRRELGSTIPLDTVVERLATAMSTRTNTGTYDDFLVGGLQNYITYHGNELFVESYFTPDYTDMRIIFEEKEMLPILGLSGNPGLYVVLSGMTGLDNGSGNYAITISDPITGTSIETYMRNIGESSQVLYDGSWLGLDIAIALSAISQSNSRIKFGEAAKVISNWQYDWESSTAMADDSLYYITAIGTDMVHRNEVSTTLIQYHCNLGRVLGDIDGNGFANSMDILALINYIYQGGAAPTGGAHRADTNCDNQIDIGDVIFMVKYVFESGEVPCY